MTPEHSQVLKGSKTAGSISQPAISKLHIPAPAPVGAMHGSYTPHGACDPSQRGASCNTDTTLSPEGTVAMPANIESSRALEALEQLQSQQIFTQAHAESGLGISETTVDKSPAPLAQAVGHAGGATGRHSPPGASVSASMVPQDAGCTTPIGTAISSRSSTIQPGSQEVPPDMGRSLRTTMDHFGLPAPPQNHLAADNWRIGLWAATEDDALVNPLLTESPMVTGNVPDGNAVSGNMRDGVQPSPQMAASDLHTTMDTSIGTQTDPGATEYLADAGDAPLRNKPLQPRLRGLPGNVAHQSQSSKEVCRQSSSASACDRRHTEASASIQMSPQPASQSTVPDEELSISVIARRISIRDLAELRSLRYPPAVVCQVLEAVAVLLGITDSRWARMRKLLDNGFVERISTFDPSTITPAQADRLRVLLQVPTFSDSSLFERCPAIVSLTAWCNAVGRHLAEAAKSSGPYSSVDEPMLTAETTFEPHFEEPPQLAWVNAERPDLGGLEVTPDLWTLPEAELAHVQELRVSREGVGSVTFHGATDCREFIKSPFLGEVVVLNPGEVVVYPNQKIKPPVGQGLNKFSSIVLYGCLPKKHSFKDKKARDRYKKRVRQMTEEKGAFFVDYDCEKGIWQFNVAHF